MDYHITPLRYWFSWQTVRELQWVDCTYGPTFCSGLSHVTYFGQSVVSKYDVSRGLGSPCSLRLALLLFFRIMILIIFFSCPFTIIVRMYKGESAERVSKADGGE